MRHVSTGLSIALGIGLLIAISWVGCSAFLKNNDAYERGLATTLADPVLEDALGAPLEEGWFINGTVEGDGMTTHGVWLVRIRGTEETGTLRIAGVKSSGLWRVVQLSVEADDVRYDYVPEQGFREAKPGTAGAGPRDITGALEQE